MSVQKGKVTDASSKGFIGQVLWEGTDNSNGIDWVEAGYTYDWKGINELVWYWADTRPTYGYDEHLVPTTVASGPTVGQTMPIRITYTGSNEWKVYWTSNRTQYGKSVSNPPYSNYMSSGLESTSSSNVLGQYATSPHLGYRTKSGTWIAGWSSAASIISTSPAHAAWRTQYTALEDYMN